MKRAQQLGFQVVAPKTAQWFLASELLISDHQGFDYTQEPKSAVAEQPS
jgi:hypothetical protein